MTEKTYGTKIPNFVDTTQLELYKVKEYLHNKGLKYYKTSTKTDEDGNKFIREVILQNGNLFAKYTEISSDHNTSVTYRTLFANTCSLNFDYNMYHSFIDDAVFTNPIVGCYAYTTKELEEMKEREPEHPVIEAISVTLKTFKNFADQSEDGAGSQQE